MRPPLFAVPSALCFALSLSAAADEIRLGDLVAQNGDAVLPSLRLPRDHFDSDAHLELHAEAPSSKRGPSRREANSEGRGH